MKDYVCALCGKPATQTKTYGPGQRRWLDASARLRSRQCDLRRARQLAARPGLADQRRRRDKSPRVPDEYRMKLSRNTHGGLAGQTRGACKVVDESGTVPLIAEACASRKVEA